MSYNHPTETRCPWCGTQMRIRPEFTGGYGKARCDDCGRLYRTFHNSSTNYESIRPLEPTYTTLEEGEYWFADMGSIFWHGHAFLREVRSLPGDKPDRGWCHMSNSEFLWVPPDAAGPFGEKEDLVRWYYRRALKGAVEVPFISKEKDLLHARNGVVECGCGWRGAKYWSHEKEHWSMGKTPMNRLLALRRLFNLSRKEIGEIVGLSVEEVDRNEKK